ncbi:MAG: hypothetical protein OEV35_03750 [Gallionellaceae bacterium]|nr:hypothetical protein [Gallionellaceae bacterium]
MVHKAENIFIGIITDGLRAGAGFLRPVEKNVPSSNSTGGAGHAANMPVSAIKTICYENYLSLIQIFLCPASSRDWHFYSEASELLDRQG